ncbi:calmodulin, putative [Leishmania tarentolae]|uniref:Calmodulin, putative n=1 Tax=Leishmania tarentolae TaxID=5689 RepID=A0A640KBA6_LEITA|nr:calmodulin, putative [Leishmania tarentolae]
MEQLSATEQQELKEIFDLIDTERSGVISLHELRNLMTALHLKPTEQELEEAFGETCSFASMTKGSAGPPLTLSSSVPSSSIAAAAPRDGGIAKNPNSGNNAQSDPTAAAAAERVVTFPQFATMMARRVQSEYTAKQLCNAFQLFESPDMPEGFVSTSVLARALATYGSKKLEKEEIDRLMKVIDPNNTGRVNYYEFVDTVTE